MLQACLSSFILFVFRVMVFFMSSVFISMGWVLWYRGTVHYMGHKKEIAESIAFLFSILALVLMGYPSMALLFEYRSQTRVDLIVKVVGAQWYWRFEVGDLMEDAVLMYMLPLDELSVGQLRFLEVDNRLVLPSGVLVQFNVTRSDVIHSFAMPTLGLKVDAVAGLLRVVPLRTAKIGLHYGQCSEICGMNHAFIPFCLEVTTIPAFFYWVLGLED